MLLFCGACAVHAIVVDIRSYGSLDIMRLVNCHHHHHQPTAPICVMLCVRAASVISYIENTFLFLLLVDMNQLKKRTLLHICYGY